MTSTASRRVPALPQRATDFALVTVGWAVALIGAAAFPLDNPQLARAALFVHLISMAVAFGAVVMIDMYGLLWLFGSRTLADLADLAGAAHSAIAAGVGGLLASGIALRPDFDTPLARFKMVLVLVLMLNGVAAQRALQGMRWRLSPTTAGDSIPWAGFRRLFTAAIVSQVAWMGSIAIGFITSLNRNG